MLYNTHPKYFFYNIFQKIRNTGNRIGIEHKLINEKILHKIKKNLYNYLKKIGTFQIHEKANNKIVKLKMHYRKINFYVFNLLQFGNLSALFHLRSRFYHFDEQHCYILALQLVRFHEKKALCKIPAISNKFYVDVIQ